MNNKAAVDKAQEFIADIQGIKIGEGEYPSWLTALSCMSGETVVKAAMLTGIPISVLRQRFIETLDIGIERFGK